MLSRFTLCAVMFLFSTIVLYANEPVTIKMEPGANAAPISPYIYGQFIEHLGRCINGGGIWAEMLEDRKFYHSVGSKESPWKPLENSSVRMNETDPFVGKHSPECYTDESQRIGIFQSGLAMKKGKEYRVYIWFKASEGIERVGFQFRQQGQDKVRASRHQTVKKTGDYQRIEGAVLISEDLKDVVLEVAANGKGTFTIGTVSVMPTDNVHGMRADTLELLKRLDSPVYRWPGGNFVSGYDWKDGVGDRDKRPPRKNPAWQGVESNDFGIDEFLLFCEILKTEPYIAVNTGNGDVANAIAEWEYVNKKKPNLVKYWGIGNEMYGNWQIGHMPVEKYVDKHNEFVKAFREKSSDIQAVAVGAVGSWDENFLPGAAKSMDLISEHFYVREKRDITEHAWQVPNNIRRIADAHRKYRAELPGFKDLEKPVPIAMDEWNFWYGSHVFGELGTRYFMKDALGIAAGIHEYARQSDMYFMANYAQTVNVIGCIKTSKTDAKMETTGLVLELYRKHFGNMPVKTVHSSKTLDIQAAMSLPQQGKEDNAGLTIGIVNTLDKPETVKLEGMRIPGGKKTLYEIADPQSDPNGFNAPDQPYRIEIVETPIESFDGTLTVKPFSVTLVKFAE